MAQNFEDSSVISINHSHKFQVDIERKSNLKDPGDFVDGEKFSPVSGFVFQLRILNKDNDSFSTSVKNCGKESVKILNLEMKHGRGAFEGKVEKKNFTLLPDGVMALLDLVFVDDNWGWDQTFGKRFKDFRCNLEIEVHEGNQIIGLNVTS